MIDKNLHIPIEDIHGMNITTKLSGKSNKSASVWLVQCATWGGIVFRNIVIYTSLFWEGSEIGSARGMTMICIKTEIPQEICNIDDELKAIYHSKDTICLWIFKNREDRNRFMDETVGMIKDEREKHFETFYE